MTALSIFLIIRNKSQERIPQSKNEEGDAAAKEVPK
jgi:hypothetical protein